MVKAVSSSFNQCRPSDSGPNFSPSPADEMFEAL